MKVKDIRALRSDEYEIEHRTNERIEGLYCGGAEWREQLSYWLPSSEVEPAGLYAERKKRATYEPILPVIVNLTVGAVFAEAPVVDGLPDDLWERLEADADGARTAFVTFFAEQMRSALLYHRCWTWVEVPPAAAPEVSAADSRARLSRLYLRAIDPECIMAHTHDEQGRLAAVLMEEKVITRPDIARPPERSVRWTAVDAERIRVWTWRPKRAEQHDPDDNDDVEGPVETLHGYGTIPIAAVELNADQALGWRLLDPCTAHCRAWNELDWALYRAATELLVVTSRAEVPTPKTGHGYWLGLSRDADGSDAATYVGPSGRSLDLLTAREKDARTAVYRAAQHLQMAADPTSAAARQSAESKARDAEATAILLDTYGDVFRDHITEISRMIAQLVGADPAGVSCTGLQGKERTDPAAVLKAHALAGDLMNASPTARVELLKQEATALLPDVGADVMAKIVAELEADITRTPPGAGGIPDRSGPPDPNAPPDPTNAAE